MKRVVLLVFFAACAPAGPPVVTSLDAQRANIELADLQHGRQLLIGKCTNCHRAPMPSDHAAAEWPSKLAEMSQRAHLDMSQRLLIEKYLVTMATR